MKFTANSEQSCHRLFFFFTPNRVYEKAVLPSLMDEGGGGISPTRPTVAVLAIGEEKVGLDGPLGRGGATEANFFGWL